MSTDTPELVTQDRRPNQIQVVTPVDTTRRPTLKVDNRPVNPNPTIPRDYEGATPSIGSILAIRSKNVSKNVDYDVFCKKLQIYITNEFKNRDHIVEVTKNPSEDVLVRILKKILSQQICQMKKKILYQNRD